MIRRLAVVLSLVLGTIAVTAAPEPAAAKCARVYLQPYVATPADTVLPIDGGAILVGLTGRQDGKEDMDALPDSFTMVKGKKRIELTVEPLVPGFARLVPKSAPSAGKWTIEGVLQREYNEDGDYDPATVTFGDATAASPPPAPSVTAASVTESRYGRGFLRLRVAAELAGEPPQEAFMLLASWGDAANTDAGGASYISIDEDDGLLTIYRNRGRCSGAPSGERGPEAGEKAVLRWVDATGQVSEPSKAFEVEQPTEPTKF